MQSQSFTPSQVQMPKVLTAFFKVSESDDDDDGGIEGQPGFLFDSRKSSAGFAKSMAYERIHVSLFILEKSQFLDKLTI